MRLACIVFSLTLISCTALHPQSLALSTKEITIRQAAGGPLGVGRSVRVGAAGDAGEWTAAITGDGDPSWVYLSAASGKLPASVYIGLVNWRAEAQKAGRYTATVKFSANGASESVKVDWTVVDSAPGPKFTYLAGPAGCETPAGYPDAALCNPLDQSAIGQFVKPAPGATYVDPNFGAKIKILTGTGIHHTYSTPNPLSANNTYLMTFPADGTFDILSAATGKTVKQRVEGNQNYFWDANDDEAYYTLDGAAIFRYGVKRGKRTKVADYSKAPYKFTAIARGGTGDTSKDNWISFFADNEKQVCALDITGVKTYCADYAKISGPPLGKIDYSLISKGTDKISGKRYVILVAAGTAPAFYSVNAESGKLDFAFRGPEDLEKGGNHDGACDPGEKCMYPSHADTLEDSAGIQYLVYNSQTEVPCEVSIATYQLNRGPKLMEPAILGGGRTKVMTLWKCPFPNSPGPDDHVACAKKAPYCVISTVPPLRAAADAPLRFAHTTEILIFRENGLEVRRLAQTRSVPLREEGGESYWSQSHGSIANDASLIIFDSNFGQANAQRVNVLETGIAKR
ncbi:MAG: hypothetical protein ABI822_32110 [Bryobacteraceae bacterium]